MEKYLTNESNGKVNTTGGMAASKKLRDELTGALIGLARASVNATGVNDGTWRIIIEGTAATAADVNADEAAVNEMLDRVHAEKLRLAPDCATCSVSCGRTADYDMEKLRSEDENVRNLKSLILTGVRTMAVYAHYAMTHGCEGADVNAFIAKALFAIGEDWDVEYLLPILKEAGDVNLRCIALAEKTFE